MQTATGASKARQVWTRYAQRIDAITSLRRTSLKAFQAFSDTTTLQNRRINSIRSKRICAMQASNVAEELHARYSPTIKAIHESPTKAVLYVTGGASQALSWLLSESGASGTVLECCVPYSREATVEILGKAPEQFCSSETAVALSKVALKRAAALSPFGTPIVGVGATCGLISGPVSKRGDHRAWVAISGSSETRILGVKMVKSSRTRLGEDILASQILLQGLAHACGLAKVAKESPLDLLEPTEDGCEIIQVDVLPEVDPLDELIAGRIRCLEYSGGKALADCPRPGRVYLSGSFNPLHSGHEKLLETASEMLGRESCFELAICNADKGTLSKEIVKQRIEQFVCQGLPVVITMEPFFTGKAEILQNSVFVVGHDTAIRLINTKYYSDSEVEMARKFSRLEDLGCAFAVAGRLSTSDGLFRVMDDIKIPDFLKSAFCLSIPESKMRVDLSSTEIRKKQAQESASLS